MKGRFTHLAAQATAVARQKWAGVGFKVTVCNALSSVQTAVLVFGVSSIAGLDAVGSLTLVLVPLGVSLGVQRTSLIQSYLVKEIHVRFDSVLVTMACLSTLSAIATATIVWIGHLPLALMLACPLVLTNHLYDLMRYEWFSKELPNRVLVADSVVLCFTIIAILVIGILGLDSQVVLSLLCWVTACLAGAMILKWPRVRTWTPRFEDARLLAYISTETAFTLGIAQVLTLGLGFVLSTVTLGEFRVAQQVISPLALISLSVVTAAATSGVQRGGLTKAYVTLASLTVVGSLAIVVDPLGLVQRLGIRNANDFAVVVAVLGAAGTLSVSNYVAMIRLRPRSGRSAKWLTARALLCSSEPIVGLSGAALLGAPGAALGVLVHQFLLRTFLAARGWAIDRSHADPATQEEVSGR